MPQSKVREMPPDLVGAFLYSGGIGRWPAAPRSAGL